VIRYEKMSNQIQRMNDPSVTSYANHRRDLGSACAPTVRAVPT
jgi:hypothetical protein